MHLCEFERAYISGRRRKQHVSRHRSARNRVSAMGGFRSWLRGWENRNGSVAETQSYFVSYLDFVLTFQAMSDLEAMANRCALAWAEAELGDNFKIAKSQLRAFWLWTWVRNGMHPAALVSECNSRTDEAIASLAKECREACGRLAALEATMRPKRKRKTRRVDWRTEPLWAVYRDAEEEVRRLQEKWFTTFAPCREIFDPDTDYAAKWRQVCKDHRKQARRDRRNTRRAAAGAA